MRLIGPVQAQSGQPLPRISSNGIVPAPSSTLAAVTPTAKRSPNVLTKR